jgi:lactoylglutathione lyase
MKIEHLAIWVKDLEKMRRFYEKFFHAKSGERYHNPNKNFTSYFLSFDEGCRLELMHKPEIEAILEEEGLGLAHFAISLGSKEKVDRLTEDLREAGYEIAGESRTTGDGYYESVILDPERNRVELTV